MGDDNEHKQQVQAFIDILAERYGLSDEDISIIAQELVSLHKRNKRYERYGDLFARTFIVLFAGALFSGLGYALVAFIRGVRGQ